MSRWHFKWRCSTCQHHLTDREVYYSHGVCPYCGFDNCSTICAREKQVIRHVLVRKAAWWKKLLGLDADEYRLETK